MCSSLVPNYPCTSKVEAKTIKISTQISCHFQTYVIYRPTGKSHNEFRRNEFREKGRNWLQTFELILILESVVDFNCVPDINWTFADENCPLDASRFDADVIKLAMATLQPAVASVVPSIAVTSVGFWLTCNRFRRVTNSLLKLFKRCCKWTASFEDEASEEKRKYIKYFKYLSFAFSTLLIVSWISDKS